MAYELLTGRRPFHADSLATLAHMIVFAERPSARAVESVTASGCGHSISPEPGKVSERTLSELYGFCGGARRGIERRLETVVECAIAATGARSRLRLRATRTAAPTSRYDTSWEVLYWQLVLTGVLLNKVLPLRRETAPVIATQPAVSPGAKVSVHRKSNKTIARLAKDSGAKPEGVSGANKQNPPVAGLGTLDPGAVYRPGVDVSEPVVLSKVDPEYTAVARELRAHGIVVLNLVVQRNGAARDFQVIQPMGYGLDEKAIEAVHKWRFEPGMKDGNAVSVRTTVDVIFLPPVTGEGAEWESGAMDFPVEAGLTPPIVEVGTLPKPDKEGSADGVVLAFTVTSSGSVKNIQAIGLSQSPEFLRRSLAAWKFRPARKGNLSVEATGTVRFVKSRRDEDARLALSSSRPQSNPPERQTAASSAGVILTPLDPATVEDRSVSINSNTPALIEFVNRSSSAVDVYWINGQGNRRLEGANVAIGATYREQTFLTHPFLVVVSGTGGTTAKDTGIRLAGFEAVTPNANLDFAKRDIAIITNRDSGGAVANAPGTGYGLSHAQLANANLIPAKALELLRQAANRGEPSAMVELGEAYMADNAGEAALWFRKAADVGNSSAMLHLGGMYELGSGVRKDYGAAAQWYSKAADGGNADAMYHLGRMYENGHGVAKDLNQAYKFYIRAGGLGNMDAKANLARLKGTPN